jgi:sarcosine oxidase subunit beta
MSEDVIAGETRTEIAVVGAGILGLSTALTLARAGRDVLVIDRGAPWREGSAVNAGTLAVHNKDLALLDLYVPALAEWPRFAAELDGDAGYLCRGGLRVASTEADVVALRAARPRFAAHGIELEWLEGNALHAAAPWLGPTIVGASHCAQDAFASPLLAGRALIRSIRKARGRVVGDAGVTAARRAADGFVLVTPRGTVRCTTVVVAAGTWADDVAALLGARLPLRPRINILSVTERLAPFMDNLVVTHAAGRFTLKQFANGSCVLGGGFPGRGSHRTGVKEVDFAQWRENLRFQCEVVPVLARANLLRSWAGFTSSPADHLPAFGASSAAPGLFFACSPDTGFSCGPMIGRLVGEAILGRALPEWCARFSPDRFVSWDPDQASAA